MIADITARFACVSVNSNSSSEVTGNLWKNKSNMVVKKHNDGMIRVIMMVVVELPMRKVIISIALATLMTTIVMTMIMRTKLLVKSVCETAPIFLFWAPSCGLVFEYAPSLAC